MFENIENERQEDLLQEWSVFKALCGEELMSIVTIPNPSAKTFYKIMEMFTVLGFESLQGYYLTEIYLNKHKTVLKIKEEYNNTKNNLVNLFIDNIESEGLKDLFVKRADYFS